MGNSQKADLGYTLGGRLRGTCATSGEPQKRARGLPGAATCRDSDTAGRSPAQAQSGCVFARGSRCSSKGIELPHVPVPPVVARLGRPSFVEDIALLGGSEGALTRPTSQRRRARGRWTESARPPGRSQRSVRWPESARRTSCAGLNRLADTSILRARSREASPIEAGVGARLREAGRDDPRLFRATRRRSNGGVAQLVRAAES